MVRFPFDFSGLESLAEDYFIELDRVISFSTNLTKFAPRPYLRPLVLELRKLSKDIIIAKPKQLEAINLALKPLWLQAVNDAEKLLKARKKKNNKLRKGAAEKYAANQLFEIFNYKKFSDSDAAYWLIMKYGLSTCPYCNSQYIFSQKTPNQKFRPHYDHFYPKSRYPFFAVSFYNLIPSCYFCNSSLKGDEDVTLSNCVHPYQDDIAEMFKFKTDAKGVDFITDSSKIKIFIEPNSTLLPSDKKRLDNFFRIFGIEDRYSFFHPIVGDIVNKIYVYPESQLKEFLKKSDNTGYPIFNTKREVIQFVLGNRLDSYEMHKQILSKMTKDIADSLGWK